MTTSSEIRQKYLDFFESKGHKVIPSASLIPENDPSVLFTTAGMHPLVPYLLGEKHPGGVRLTDVQKCIRTGDIDEVGDSFHHTFFEMLGNWSLGNYFKKEAIEFSFEFLTSTQWLGLDKNRLAVSVFEGDTDAPFDDEAFEIWKSLGIPEKRIAKLPKKNNWWGPAGETGPCGPDTEMFYWVGDADKIPESFNDDNNLWLEIWNDVFMQYNKKKKVLLIDGMFCLYDKDFNINSDLLNKLSKYNTKKILVVNGFSEKAKEILSNTDFEVFSLEKECIKKDNREFFEKLKNKYNLDSGELIYIDHDEKNIEGAKNAGLTNVKFYKNDTEDVVKFVNEKIYYYLPLAQKNVDTGMGLERTTAVVNGLDDNYKTELFWPIIEKIENLSGKKYEGENVKAMRIIADHIKASTFILGDEKGITPSNTGQGYVLRKLIRRVVDECRKIGVSNESIIHISQVVIDLMKLVYEELEKNKEFILHQLDIEIKEYVEGVLNKVSSSVSSSISSSSSSRSSSSSSSSSSTILQQPKTPIEIGKLLFKLRTEKGVPLDLAIQELEKNNVPVNEESKKIYEEEMKKHQELSQTSSAGMFKGGLSDAGDETKKLHTATHLLRQALEIILGQKIMQKGSNITQERLRFDFNYDSKMTDEQKQKVEDLVNQKIAENLPVRKVVMKKEEAEKTGAVHAFGDKYGDEVSLYYVGDSLETAWSKEFCGGPHVENTGILGHFRIVKEEAVSAGVRRIKAILE